jgi:hypothetical protein
MNAVTVKSSPTTQGTEVVDEQASTSVSPPLCPTQSPAPPLQTSFALSALTTASVARNARPEAR